MKARPKFPLPEVGDDEWVQPRPREFYLGCCDCGLIHKVWFRIVPGRRNGRPVLRTQFKVERDNRRTAINRRMMKAVKARAK